MCVSGSKGARRGAVLSPGLGVVCKEVLWKLWQPRHKRDVTSLKTKDKVPMLVGRKRKGELDL